MNQPYQTSVDSATRCTCPSGDGSLRWPCPAHPPLLAANGRAPAAPITTWRDRLGRPADFPLHGPTDVERAMEAEIAELRARQGQSSGRTDLSKRLREAISSFPSELRTDVMAAADEIDRYYGGMMAWKQTAETKDRQANEARMARENDRVAARAGAQAQEHASAEMLDMLGRTEPLAMHDKKDRDQWFERLCRARAVQQPLPVPDQAAVVWRSDLVRVVAELIQLRAYRDLVRVERARKDTAQLLPGDRETDAGLE